MAPLHSPSVYVVALNCGSSSLRFAVYRLDRMLSLFLAGGIERIGAPDACLTVRDAVGDTVARVRIPQGSRAAAAEVLLDWLEAHPSFGGVRAVGHRVVHGLRRSQPVPITAAVLAELQGLVPFAPDHLPDELSLIAAIRRRHPRLLQVACFDTAFHRAMPSVAHLLPIPRRYAALGVERYGFHGLSYSYLLRELTRMDPVVVRGRVIFAHLGHGASLAAVRAGKSMDTSMGFTPAAGLVMGTRSGDLDPGLLAFLAGREGMTPAGFQRLVNHESGLLGISGTSSDIRDLLDAETDDPRAAAAVELFCYQASKWIGAFAAVLGGVDAFVFSGGIGENSPVVRARICANLGFLGIRLSRPANLRSAAVISTAASACSVRVVPTDESRMIALSVARLVRAGVAAKKRR